MTHTLHLPHWSSPAEEKGRVTAVHRVGALVVAAVIAAFGVLGLADGLAYFSTDGSRVAGLSSNGLLSTISLVTAAVLVFSAVRGSRVASTTMLVIGVLFIGSALVNLALLETDWNVLAFSVANVVFSICAGLLLLTLGAYGRVSGNLPDDSPYRGAQGGQAVEESPQRPENAAEATAERAMRQAELAVVEHRATPDQQARVQAMAKVRSRSDRRVVWMSYDRPTVG